MVPAPAMEPADKAVIAAAEPEPEAVAPPVLDLGEVVAKPVSYPVEAAAESVPDPLLVEPSDIEVSRAAVINQWRPNKVKAESAIAKEEAKAIKTTAKRAKGKRRKAS